MDLTRREFALAAAMGAALATAGGAAHAFERAPRERRDLYPQGVASGDPDSGSVMLWTRRPPAAGAEARRLAVEVAEDPGFARIAARGLALLAPDSDWTVRFLAVGLRPGREYWYRFVDELGFSSRVGRTLTAPADDADVPVRFAFASCQMFAEGAGNAYRRMIFEDEAQPAGERLDFVLHLGDFIYEVVFYPDEAPGGRRRGRRLRDLVRFPDGEKVGDFHLPVTLADYRTLYRAYLEDPDLQDARARWPFVCVWDNHEFSWAGWQSQQVVPGVSRPAQTRKVAANQAWWEFLPARVTKPDPSLERFAPPAVVDAPIERFDAHGFGDEPNNLAAINSLRIFRTLRWGRNVELLLTDNHSWRTRPPESDELTPRGVRWASSRRVARILDAGRAYDGGSPPATIRYAGREVANPCRDAPPQSCLGAEQRAWLLDRLQASPARWKIWGHSFGTLEWRSDYQNLPAELGLPWPDDDFAFFNGGFHVEKAEIFDFVRDRGIAGFAIVAGDRHSFWAGLASKSLPPEPFEPVGVEFITGSICSATFFESVEQTMARDDPQRPLFLHDRADGTVGPAMNFAALHGVRSALALRDGAGEREARALRNPEVAPHLSFLDFGGHGYATVTADGRGLAAEFVCIPRPLERSERADGGPLAYRVVHRAPLWRPGETPRLVQEIVEGTPPLAI